MTAPMDDERLAALRTLATRARENGRWRTVRYPGRTEVARFVGEDNVETVTAHASPPWRAEMLAFDAHDLAELLDEIERQRAEAARWRARCPVTIDDIRESGLTGDQLAAWMVEHGWRHEPTGRRNGREVYYLERGGDGVTFGRGDHTETIDAPRVLLMAIKLAARHADRTARDVFDEIVGAHG